MLTEFGSEADVLPLLSSMEAVALDPEAEWALREDALRVLVTAEYDPGVARRLLPVLDDRRAVGGATARAEEGLRVCDYAATAIAMILEWHDFPIELSDRRERDAVIARIKAWAAEQP
jgi:hypothetical protein